MTEKQGPSYNPQKNIFLGEMVEGQLFGTHSTYIIESCGVLGRALDARAKPWAERDYNFKKTF